MAASLPALPANFAVALQVIDDAHAEDPRIVTPKDGTGGVPQELQYARSMSRWLAVRSPDAAPTLQLACRAQHFRRWELPRDSFPMTRPGYLTWRAKQKSQAADKIKSLLASSSPGLDEDAIDRIAALVRKEGLSTTSTSKDKEGGDPETQILEDVACLVFLETELDDFEGRADVDEDKMLRILRKTWAKMSPRGHEIALGLELSEKGRSLVEKALAG